MKYSETVVRKVIEALREGLPQKLAAQRAGVSEDTVSLWKSKKPEFRVQVEAAQAEFCRRNLRIIQRAATQKNGWTAAAWLLERTRPEHFALRPAPQADLGPVTIVIHSSDQRKSIGVRVGAPPLGGALREPVVPAIPPCPEGNGNPC